MLRDVAKTRQFTLFGYLYDYENVNENPQVQIIIAIYAFVITLVVCLVPTWKFSPRLTAFSALLFSWLAGYALKKWLPTYDKEILKIGLPSFFLEAAKALLLFNETLNIDYHTLGRLLGPVILISCSLFFVNTGLLSLIMYCISGSGAVYWSKLLHALCLSVITVGHAVKLLDKAQCQVRQLQILLQGEMLISVAFYSFFSRLVIKYIIVTDSGFSMSSIIVYMLWGLVGIVIGVFASYLFRQIVAYAYNDCVGQGACCMAFNLMTFTLSGIIGTDNILCVLAYGISHGASKIKFNNRTLRFYRNANEFHVILSGLIIFAFSGFYVGQMSSTFQYFDMAYIIIVFSTSIIGRIISFAILSRIIRKLNLQINWKHLVVGVQSPARGSLVLAFSLSNVLSNVVDDAPEILVQNVVLVCISYLVNIALMEPILGAIGMYNLTRAKIVNMNLAVSQVNECRSRAIQALKVDRVIADANWIVVDQATKLPHPYKKVRSSFEETEEVFGNKGQSRVVYCGDCGAKGIAPLSKKEMEDVALDIKRRILKAQRVSFYRQYENGTLGRHGVKVLSNLVEKVLVRDDPVLMARDLKIQRQGTSRMQRLKETFRLLFTITSKKHVFIPTFWLRAFCFRICTSRKFQITMACFSMIDLTLLIIMLRSYYTGGEEIILFQIADFIFFTIFILEFIIEILGIGIIQYFYSYVNLVEFACSTLVRTLQLGMYIETCIYHGEMYNVFEADPIIMYVKTLLLLRVTRMYIFAVALIPKILNTIDKKMDADLIKTYDIGKAYMITQEQLMKFLGHLVTNDEVYNTINKQLEEDRLYVACELGLIKYDRATIATTNKTCHAIRHVVNAMKSCITNMKDEEVLDLLETAALLSSLDKVKNSGRNLSLVEPLNPQALLQEIPWLKNDSNATNLFLEHARLTSYSEGEVILKAGDSPCGLIVIIEGLVKASYVPSSFDMSLNNNFGIIPNYDFYLNLKFNLPQDDYLTGSAVIGEMGLVTGRKYNMTALCETSVYALWIPTKILNAVVKRSGNAIIYQASLWKCVGIKIAINVLQDTPQFRGWSREKLFMHLQGGVIPKLTDVHTVNLGEHISDVILIEGLAMDHATRLTYVAPFYIPQTVSILLLPGSPLMEKTTNYETRLFIVPTSHSDSDDVSGPDGLFKDHIQMLDRTIYGQSTEKKRTVKDAECKKPHRKTKISSYMTKALKAQRKVLKTMKFMDYIPTINGPIERNLTLTTFLVRTEKNKQIGLCIYNKSVFYDSSFQYTGDIGELSEIKEMKGGEDNESRNRNYRGGSSISKLSRQLSSASDLSRFTLDARDDKAHSVIQVIESSEDDEENVCSKYIQTTIQMVHSPGSESPDKHIVAEYSHSGSSSLAGHSFIFNKNFTN